MNALHQIERALEPRGLVIDTQPVSAHPPVESAGGALGSLDMSEWAGTIAAVDRQVEHTIADGVFDLLGERRYLVTDEYANGDEFVAVTRDWAGTTVSDALAERAARARGRVRLHQGIRLRLLRTRTALRADV